MNPISEVHINKIAFNYDWWYISYIKDVQFSFETEEDYLDYLVINMIYIYYFNINVDKIWNFANYVVRKDQTLLSCAAEIL